MYRNFIYIITLSHITYIPVFIYYRIIRKTRKLQLLRNRCFKKTCVGTGRTFKFSTCVALSFLNIFLLGNLYLQNHFGSNISGKHAARLHFDPKHMTFSGTPEEAQGLRVYLKGSSEDGMGSPHQGCKGGSWEQKTYPLPFGTFETIIFIVSSWDMDSVWGLVFTNCKNTCHFRMVSLHILR